VVNSVCEICWREWMGTQTKIINEYRLNVLEPEHARLLREQMLTFLGLAGGEGAPPMPTP
jgi:Fe-S cluster biosynthesis and repair protein YggX